MGRRVPVGQEVGVDLLLASSDAFGHLADEMAAAHERWYEAGEGRAVLEWAQRMAEFAGWWCGRLEGEADHLVGFGHVAGSAVNPSGEPDGRPQESRRMAAAVCRRRRRR